MGHARVCVDNVPARRDGERAAAPGGSLVTRQGIVEEAEWEQGEWRHWVRTGTFTVVVAFPEEMLLAVVTCWRNNK